ncbi:MAG: beta-hydroxyacyl-ACP dehydratase [Planctomycetota bacterium]|nr:beta-hydroxyacyl-ACP dehydratase [Planctomycetota bacterium]
MSRAEIEAAIPHRDPFLFVDRVLERTDDSLVAEWTVPPEAEWFRGHYPGNPVTPGAILCEHVFQTAAVLLSHALGGFAEHDGIPVLVKVNDARFRRVVRPGETLTTTVKLEERFGPAWILSGRIRCGDARVLQVGFVLSATKALARAAEGQ